MPHCVVMSSEVHPKIVALIIMYGIDATDASDYPHELSINFNTGHMTLI